MEQLTTRIGIEPGSGLVGRFGDTVILIPRIDTAGDSGGDAATSPYQAVQELLSLAAELASDRHVPANAIASRLAAWVIGHMSGDAPAFGLVAPVRDGVVMFLRGAVWCTIAEGGSAREVSGQQALTWVDQIVPGTFDRLAIGAVGGRPVQADPLSDLRAGVVPGQGFVLHRIAGSGGREPALAESDAALAGWDVAPAGSDAALAGWDVAPAGSDAALAGSGGLTGSGGGLAEAGGPLAEAGGGLAEAGGPLAGAGAGSAGSEAASASGPEPGPSAAGSDRYAWSPSAEEPADRPQEPWALRAEPQDHHQPTMLVRPGEQDEVPSRAATGPSGPDRPAGPRAEESGRPPAVQPTAVVPVPSRQAATPPSLSVLTSQDGPPIVLDRTNYVLGREPQQDPAVESGEAVPVQLQDPDHVISRVHAYVSVENDIVLVRDADSMHGTYFSPPGGEQWTRITAEPSPLPPGWNLQIGPKVFTLELTEPGHER
jgi:FHA domain